MPEIIDGQEVAGKVDAGKRDPITGVLVGITYPHHEAHSKDSFICDYVDEALSDADTLIIAFKTMPAPKRAHLIVNFNTLVGGNLEVWKGVTWTTNTGDLNPIQNRFNEIVQEDSALLEDKTATPAFTATSNMLVNVTGLATGGATSVHHFYAWGKKERIPAGGLSDVEEIQLAPDTQYAIVFTADGDNNKAQVTLNWYEHTDL